MPPVRVGGAPWGPGRALRLSSHPRLGLAPLPLRGPPTVVISPVPGCARRPCVAQVRRSPPGPRSWGPLPPSRALQPRAAVGGWEAPRAVSAALALSRAVPGPTFGESGEAVGLLSQLWACFSAPTVHCWARGCSRRPPRPRSPAACAGPGTPASVKGYVGRWQAPGTRSVLPGAQQGAPRDPGRASFGCRIVWPVLRPPSCASGRRPPWSAGGARGPSSGCRPAGPTPQLGGPMAPGQKESFLVLGEIRDGKFSIY